MAFEGDIETDFLNSNAEKGVTVTFGDNSGFFSGEPGRKPIPENSYLTEQKLFDIMDHFGEDICELYDLKYLLTDCNIEVPSAYMLIVRNPYPDILDYLEEIMLIDKEFLDKDGNLDGIEWDKEKFDKIYKNKVVRSVTRYNLEFDDLKHTILKDRSEFYEGVPTTYNFNRILPLKTLYDRLNLLGLSNLNIKANYYYDLSKTFIPFHQDRERNKTIGYRLGDTFPFHIRWYTGSTPVSDNATVYLNRGDLYMMTDFTNGRTVLYPSELHLKHAAGSDKRIFKNDKGDTIPVVKTKNDITSRRKHIRDSSPIRAEDIPQSPKRRSATMYDMHDTKL